MGIQTKSPSWVKAPGRPAHHTTWRRLCLAGKFDQNWVSILIWRLVIQPVWQGNTAIWRPVPTLGLPGAGGGKGTVWQVWFRKVYKKRFFRKSCSRAIFEGCRLSGWPREARGHHQMSPEPWSEEADGGKVADVHALSSQGRGLHANVAQTVIFNYFSLGNTACYLDILQIVQEIPVLQEASLARF